MTARHVGLRAALRRPVVVCVRSIGPGCDHRRRRRACACRFVRQDAYMRTVQDLPGRAGLQTTARYLHSDTRAKRAAVGRLAAVFASAHEASGE
jgi:hypothetical protein